MADDRLPLSKRQRRNAKHKASPPRPVRKSDIAEFLSMPAAVNSASSVAQSQETQQVEQPSASVLASQTPSLNHERCPSGPKQTARRSSTVRGVEAHKADFTVSRSLASDREPRVQDSKLGMYVPKSGVDWSEDDNDEDGDFGPAARALEATEKNNAIIAGPSTTAMIANAELKRISKGYDEHRILAMLWKKRQEVSRAVLRPNSRASVAEKDRTPWTIHTAEVAPEPAKRDDKASVETLSASITVERPTPSACTSVLNPKTADFVPSRQLGDRSHSNPPQIPNPHNRPGNKGRGAPPLKSANSTPLRADAAPFKPDLGCDSAPPFLTNTTHDTADEHNRPKAEKINPRPKNRPSRRQLRDMSIDPIDSSLAEKIELARQHPENILQVKKQVTAAQEEQHVSILPSPTPIQPPSPSKPTPQPPHALPQPFPHQNQPPIPTAQASTPHPPLSQHAAMLDTLSGKDSPSPVPFLTRITEARERGDVEGAEYWQGRRDMEDYGGWTFYPFPSGGGVSESWRKAVCEEEFEGLEGFEVIGREFGDWLESAASRQNIPDGQEDVMLQGSFSWSSSSSDDESQPDHPAEVRTPLGVSQHQLGECQIIATSISAPSPGRSLKADVVESATSATAPEVSQLAGEGVCTSDESTDVEWSHLTVQQRQALEMKKARMVCG